MTPTTPTISSRVLAVQVTLARVGSASAKELAALTGIPVSAVYRQLDALLEAGLVQRSATRGQFCAGPESLRLAESYRREALTSGRVTLHLRRAAERSGELAAYLVRSGMDALCVDSVEGRHILRCSYSPGRAQPLIRGASAVALLAFSAPGVAAEVLDQLDVPAAERAQLDRRIEMARRARCAVSDGAVDAGVWGVSAPVLAQGELAGVVTLMAPSVRAESRRDELIAVALVTAEELSRNQEAA